MTAGALGLAFAAGIVSFVSPCVLPLIPGYLAATTGLAPQELATTRSLPRRLRASLAFACGFALVFVVLGALAGSLGAGLAGYRPELTRAAGILVVALGFVVAGALPLPLLERELSFAPGRSAAAGTGSAVALGAAFGLCWTPCVGPVLASILLVSTSQGALPAAVLLLAYAIGLAVPLVLVALAFARALRAMRFLRDRYTAIRIVAGSVLVALGLTLFFDRLWVLDVYVNRALEALGITTLPTL
jgi:cytochrome c-type biogenesis protein